MPNAPHLKRIPADRVKTYAVFVSETASQAAFYSFLNQEERIDG